MTKFSDLNLVDSRLDEKRKQKTIERAARLGYEVVAIDHKQSKLDRKTKIPSAPQKPKDVESDHLKVQGKQIIVLSRLTVTMNDSAQTIVLRSDSVSTYDLLAVEPTTEKMFHKACTELEVDIISCDMTTKLPFYFKHHSIKPALERGVQFEICYSPAIRDTSLRRNVFHNALALVSACKGKNIIISSAVENAMELRGPHDVANLSGIILSPFTTDDEEEVFLLLQGVFCAKEGMLAAAHLEAERKEAFHTSPMMVNFHTNYGKPVLVGSSGKPRERTCDVCDGIFQRGSLFGLNEDKGKATISTNCQSALIHAFTRNGTIRSTMSIQKVTDLAPDEFWKVKASLDASGLSVEQLRKQEACTAKKKADKERTPGEEPQGKRQKQR